MDKEPTTTAVSDTYQRLFKEKASTQQPIPLKLNAFHFTEMYNSDQMKVVEHGTW